MDIVLNRDGQTPAEPESKAKRFSYSKLNTYKDCPFKYKLQYVDGHYAFSDSIATEFGTAIHAAEEAIAIALRANQPVDYIKIKNDLIYKFALLEHKYTEDYLLPDNKSYRTYREKAYGYLNIGIYKLEQFMREHPTYEIIGIEQKFSFIYNNSYTFTGAIDRVFRDNSTNTYLIQDIKTWAVPEEDDKLKTPLQFVVYVLAAKELWGANPETITCQYYLPLVDNGITQNGGTNGFIGRGIKKLDAIFAKIAGQDFAPKPSPLCNYCSFCQTNPSAAEDSKYLCPYYSLWSRDTRNRADINRCENKWQGLAAHGLVLEKFYKKYNIQIRPDLDRLN